jgi:hypothetical protein
MRQPAARSGTRGVILRIDPHIAVKDLSYIDDLWWGDGLPEEIFMSIGR